MDLKCVLKIYVHMHIALNVVIILHYKNNNIQQDATYAYNIAGIDTDLPLYGQEMRPEHVFEASIFNT